MSNSFLRKNLTEQIGFGLTAAALIGAFSLCVCAVMGQGLWAFLLCCTICIFSSLLNKNNVFAPTPLLLIPVIYMSSKLPSVYVGISILLGAVFYLLFKKRYQEDIPDYIKNSTILGLVIASTIIFTNDYFGIGAIGATPAETLSFYRSLGFHPNFRGLLYGTITLFTMITFPFKFKKLNKYLPAPFITILIPFILNLFLNPQKDLTTINEAATLTLPALPLENALSFSAIATHFSYKTVLNTLICGYTLAILFLILGNNEKGLCAANSLSGLFTLIPVKTYKIRGYGVISAVAAFFTICAITLLCPDIFARLPMHTAGAMLIVSAWQSVPFKELAIVFKRKNVLEIISFAICTIVFIAIDYTAASAIAFIFIIFKNNKKTLPEERSVRK